MLEDIFAGLGGGLTGAANAYSFIKQLEAAAADREERKRRGDVEESARSAEVAHRDQRDTIADQRYEQGLRRENARDAASMLQPNQQIDDLTYSFLKDTPFEARVNDSGLLPAQPVPGFDTGIQQEPGGRTWRPTQAEAQNLTRERDQRAFVSSLPGIPQRTERARSLGLTIPADDLMTPEEPAALGGPEPAEMPVTSRDATPQPPSAVPVTPRGAAPSQSGPAAAVPKPGDVIMVRGQRVKVTKVNRDGTIQGVHAGS